MGADNHSPIRITLRAGAALGAALGGGALFIGILWMTFGDAITNAREEYAIQLARETLAPKGYKNPPVIFIPQKADLAAARIIAVACVNDNNNNALVIRGAAKRGYGGEIEFVASFINNAIGGIRIIRHRETPGIADFLDTAEGGKESIDGIAGATITSAAMTMALDNLLEWQKQKQLCKQSNAER